MTMDLVSAQNDRVAAIGLIGEVDVDKGVPRHPRCTKCRRKPMPHHVDWHRLRAVKTRRGWAKGPSAASVDAYHPAEHWDPQQVLDSNLRILTSLVYPPRQSVRDAEA